MTLETILNQIHPLPDTSTSRLRACVREVEYPKGHILLQAGKIESKIFLIKKGIARAYAFKNEEETSFWFGMEGDAVISMRSYVNAQKGYENIELLEPSSLYVLDKSQLQHFYETDIHIANWGRKFAEKELIKTEERLIALQFQNASQRYLHLLRHQPQLLQRVQLSHIASYLGITPVSLSRIRSSIK